MRIGFLIGNMSHSGGTERVLQQIANGLSERGYPITVISVWGTDQLVFPLDPEITFRRLGDTYPNLPGEHLRTIRALRRVVQSESLDVLVDVDLILTVYSLPGTVGMRGLKRVAWEHFNFNFPFPKNGKLRGIARRLAARFSDAIVVLTKEDQACYQKNLRIRGRLCQICNPNPFQHAVQGGAEEHMVFTAGRLTHIKGFDLLLESWAMLEKDFPDWKLCIAGDGEERQALQELIREKGLNAVELVGEVSDIKRWYSRSAFYVLPSRNEGFGMVLLEAMSCGKTAVSFSSMGPRDILTDGATGFLVPQGDTAAFAKAMRRLMESPELRRDMGALAQKSLKRFDQETILSQWEELLGARKADN